MCYSHSFRREVYLNLHSLRKHNIKNKLTVYIIYTMYVWWFIVQSIHYKYMVEYAV